MRKAIPRKDVTMKFDILTLLPEFFVSPLTQGVIGRAVTNGLLEVGVHNIRDYTLDKHRTADDYPYGGGLGMVLKAEPIVRCLEAIAKTGEHGTRVILTSPCGVRFNHNVAKELAGINRIVIICGRYEGVDERIKEFVNMELSVGDYVLTGGEIPALAVIDAVGRLIPGVLGADDSSGNDSFTDGLLEYPQYTRPEEFRGMNVPPVLLSGNHAEVDRWRRAQSLKRTCLRRPELLRGVPLTEEEKAVIEELKKA